MRLVASFFYCLMAFALAADKTKTYGTRTIKFLGSSGGMQINDDGNVITIKQQKLQEVDSSGNDVSNSKMNVAGGSNSWSEPVEEDGMLSTSFTVTESPKSMKLWVYYNSGTSEKEQKVPKNCSGCSSGTTGDCITTSQQCSPSSDGTCTGSAKPCENKVKIPSSTLEFALEMSAFDFTANTNSLDYGVIVTSASKGETEGKPGKSEGAKSADKNEFTVTFPQGKVVSDTMVSISGGAADREVAIADPTIESASSGTTITWRLPHFAVGEKLVLDPSLFVSSSSVVVPSLLFLLVALLQ